MNDTLCAKRKLAIEKAATKLIKDIELPCLGP